MGQHKPHFYGSPPNAQVFFLMAIFFVSENISVFINYLCGMVFRILSILIAFFSWKSSAVSFLKTIQVDVFLMAFHIAYERCLS